MPVRCRIAGPDRAPGVDDELVQRVRAGQGAEHAEDARVGVELEDLARRVTIGRARACRNRAPEHLVLRRVASVHRVREEHASCEWRGEPVREAELRVRLRERGRDAERLRGHDHRPGDVSAAAQHDVRPAPAEDRAAGVRRGARLDEGADERGRRLAREAADRERVQLVAGLRNQLRFDAIGRPGERHVSASLPQCVRYCERGQDVTGRPAGGDQAPKLRRRFHVERC